MTIMKKYLLFPFIALLFLAVGCSDESRVSSPGLESLGDFDSSSSSGSSVTTGGNASEENNSGLITAGEWNDLENWDFWTEIQMDSAFLDLQDYWEIHLNNRVSVEIQNGNNPSVNAHVELKKNSETVWSTMTDNYGKAELWVNIFDQNNAQLSDDYALYINGEKKAGTVGLYTEVGTIRLQSTAQNTSNKVELAFVVDATGSMGDELEFLKDDLKSVIEGVENENSSLDISTSAVFYRDVGDDYLIRDSGFTSNFSTTLDFIKNQSAGGGGDTPEAVHSGLSKAIKDFDWTENAHTKIAFLILDAPPHHDPQVIDELKSSIQIAAAKGIKIIPITASGIAKDTELLMRQMSIATNSTYVFITNDSGIGNDHLTATVGDYEVEFLNDLMIRLINQYSE